MAQWSLTDRTLYAKLVYYGPALGGKTTNLQSIHAVTDPEGKSKLVSVNTADDRTLFFDLLPFELGSVLGYKVAIKLYTVPGQIRYDATRRAVLSGADAVVFVADSDLAREQDNKAAWLNLKQNLRATRLEGTVPILVQYNKRDLPGIAPASAMDGWFALTPGSGIQAVACQGRGVIETFLAASHAMVERIVQSAAPQTRRTLDLGDLKAQLDAAFAPHLARAADGAASRPRPAASPLVLGASDLTESAVASSVALGAQLTDQQARAARLEREAESFRRLSDALRQTGASFKRDAVADAALAAVVATLGAAGAAVCGLDREGGARIERVAGKDLAQLSQLAEVTRLLGKMLATGNVTIVDDVRPELRGVARALGLRAMAVVPIERKRNASLVVAMPAPEGRIEADDVRYLTTVAGHLAVGLEKVRVYDELRSHRDRLEDIVSARTRALSRAYEDLKSLEATKDRFLANVSHEMRSPLTAIIGAATVLHDYDSSRADAREMASGILQSAQSLERLVDGLLRTAQIQAGADLSLADASPADVVAEALARTQADGRVKVQIDPRVGRLPIDASRLATALSHLIDNAVKFGPKDGGIELHVQPCLLGRPGGNGPGVTFAVLDRGPGLGADVERAFAPFEQGGDPMTGKPTGVGLGLYEARAIARRHGGILVYQPRAGGGSEFRLSVPSEAAPAAAGVAARA